MAEIYELDFLIGYHYLIICSAIINHSIDTGYNPLCAAMMELDIEYDSIKKATKLHTMRRTNDKYSFKSKLMLVFCFCMNLFVCMIIVVVVLRKRPNG